MAVGTREQLKQYALRALGAPVLEINVDEDQLEDRLDEALEYFKLYHYDGIEKFYMKQKIRASEIVISQSIAQTFKLEDIVTGQTSGATAKVSLELGRPSTGTLLLVRNITGTFQAGETILAGAGQSATLVSATKREYDNTNTLRLMTGYTVSLVYYHSLKHHHQRIYSTYSINYA